MSSSDRKVDKESYALVNKPDECSRAIRYKSNYHYLFASNGNLSTTTTAQIKLLFSFITFLLILHQVKSSPAGTLSATKVLPTTITGGNSKTTTKTTSGGSLSMLKPSLDLARHTNVTPISSIQRPSAVSALSATSNMLGDSPLDRMLLSDSTMTFPNLNSAISSDNQQADSTTKQVLREIGAQLEGKLMPESCYIDLVGRFNDWVWRYRKLEANSQITDDRNEPLKSVPELLKSALDSANQLLEVEMCSKLADLSPQTPKDNNLEHPSNDGNISDSRFDNLDYVYKTLMKVLDKLEKLTSQLQKACDENPEEDISDELGDIVNDDEKFKRTMERTKRIALSFAGKIIRYELKSASSVDAFSSMAYFMGAPNPIDNPGNFLSIFAKIVDSLGSSSTAVTVSYLRDIEMRAALSVLNASKPLPWISCAIKKSPNKIDKSC